MDAPFYPALDFPTVKNLDLIRQLSSEHPAYWMQSEYPMDIERLIKAWFDPKTIKELVNKQRREDANTSDDAPGLDEDRYEYLYQETVNLYKEMKLAKYSGSNEDSMAYFKTAVSLQEKLISLQERSLGMKQVSDYNSMVMTFIDKICTEDQRAKFIDLLKETLGN